MVPGQRMDEVGFLNFVAKGEGGGKAAGVDWESGIRVGLRKSGCCLSCEEGGQEKKLVGGKKGGRTQGGEKEAGCDKGRKVEGGRGRH